MSAGPPDDIDRLLAWPDDGSAIPPADGKLAAALAEALAGDAPPGQDDVAGAAAYLDGGLSQAERDAFAERLAGSPVECAELAAAADLLDTVRRAPLAAPPHLAAQARARFAAAAAAAAPSPPERKRWSFALPAGPQLGWAIAAVAVVVIGPLAMLQTRTPAPFAKAPDEAQSASAVGGPGPGASAIAPRPAVGPVALAPTPPAPPKIALQPEVPKPAALALGHDAGGAAVAPNNEAVVAVSERCAAGSVPAAAPDPTAKPLSPKAQAERDACAAIRALARRRSETVTASRKEAIPGPDGMAADHMPAAASARPPIAADAASPQ